MMTRQFNGYGSSKRMPVNHKLGRSKAAFTSVAPHRFSICVHRGFRRELAVAFSVTTIVEEKNRAAKAREPRRLRCVGADVSAIAMEVDNRARTIRCRRNPPSSQSFAAALADGNLLEPRAEVRRSQINDTGGKEDEMRLAIPQQDAKQEIGD